MKELVLRGLESNCAITGKKKHGEFPRGSTPTTRQSGIGQCQDLEISLFPDVNIWIALTFDGHSTTPRREARSIRYPTTPNSTLSPNADQSPAPVDDISGYGRPDSVTGHRLADLRQVAEGRPASYIEEPEELERTFRAKSG